jgi:superfamily II DNA or RNA helicase
LASIDEFLTSLRSEFGEQEAGKKFEVFCKWFLENDPHWAKAIDKVWLWKDYPNKWQRQDLGTDLVLRDSEGLIWAVQAKCYSEHRATTKGDMNSFLADTGRKEVDRRLWMQTTNKMETKANKTLNGQDKPVTILNLNSFRDAPLEYPASFADLYEAKVKTKPTPDTHQIKAIEDTTAGLKASDRGQMIMACGTGKTFTTLWIKEALEAHTTLVLLPSLSLLSQTMREWAWASNTHFDILNVCSDKSVGKKTEDMDYSDAPFPVTSEVEQIAKFLKQPKPRVVFCTYQSSNLIAQAQIDDAVPSFDLAVADEAHRCAGKADAGFATILDGEKVRASKRLFTTATPTVSGSATKDVGNLRGVNTIGMDDEAAFGPVIHKLTFGQAIEQELLTDYQVVIVGVDEPMVREWIENYEIVSTDPDNQTDARTLASKIGMLKAVKDYDLKRVISFHSRVAGAKQFSEELFDVANLIEPTNRPEGTFLSDYVSGAMKAGDRKEKIDRLKVLEGYDRGILTNARCLAEGVDVPSLDGVAFIDPKGSQVEIIQAVGRAIRKVRGAEVQKKGTIVLPVFIEDGDDHEASIEASNFKPVWEVLRALRAHDNDMESKLDQYRTNMAKNASQNRESISDKIIFDLPVSVDAEFSSALRTVLVEASTASWEFWFGLLEKFKETEGHCLVSNYVKLDGFALGNWVNNQRRIKQILPFKNVKKLDELGFIWEVLEYRWYRALNILRHFYEKFEHTEVPETYRMDDFALRAWVKDQRKNWDKLSNRQRQELKETGFILDPHEELWLQGFETYKSYLANGGSLLVPSQYHYGQINLGTWLNSQRQNLKNGKLSQSRKKLLQDVGFVEVVNDFVWKRNFRLLANYSKKHPLQNIPVDHVTKGVNLGSWAMTQRSQFKKGLLSTDQISKLKEIDFVFDNKIDQWDISFKKFKAFTLREGHAWVPSNHVEDGLNLEHWVEIQRRQTEKIPENRKKKLNECGFIWNPRHERWLNAFEVLQNYLSDGGTFPIAYATRVNGFGLGSWASRQRKLRQEGKLSSQYIRQLNELGFIWHTSKDKT